jgi:hypothetical protein
MEKRATSDTSKRSTTPHVSESAVQPLPIRVAGRRPAIGDVGGDT